MDTILYVRPKGDGLIDSDREWHARFSATQECSCRIFRRPEYAGTPIDTTVAYAPKEGVVLSPGVGSALIARSDFAEVLSKLSPNYIIMGRVTCNGAVVRDWVTIVGAYLVQIRGGIESTVRMCPTCNRVLYFPLPVNDWHVVRSSLSGNIRAFICTFGELLMDLDSIDELPLAAKECLRFQELPLVDAPWDGVVLPPKIVY